MLLTCLIYLNLNAQQKSNYTQAQLFISNNQINSIKSRLNSENNSMGNWIKLKNKADLYVKEKLEIPTRGGNWEQYYINAITTNPLAREKQIGNWRWKHIDSKTKQQINSDSTQIDKDYDGVIIGLIHNNWALGAMELGLAYKINNDPAYLLKAKQILLGYANLYNTLPERTRSNGKLSAAGFGRIHVQDLNEAQWLVNIVLGADFIWNELSLKEQKLIAKELLYPAIETISKRKADISNIQCWRNTAIGLTGFLLKDNDLITLAMGDSMGLKAQINGGFNADGFTKDYSPNYQFFALHPLVLLANAAINNNYNVDIAPLQNMFLTPLLMSTQNFMLPPFNDSRLIKISEFAYLYEWALHQFNNPAFQEVFFIPNSNSTYIDNGYKFTAWDFIFNNSIKKIPNRLVQSKKWDNSGIAILSNGNGQNNLSCYIKYSNQIQNLRHIHNAQLDFSIVKNNEFVSTMFGNPNYASSLSDDWFRSGVAHNTLLYNEHEQRRSSGKCLGFGSSNGVDYIVTATANFYVHDAAFVRTIATINEKTILVIDQFRGTKPEAGIFDIFYHQEGSLIEPYYGSNWFPPLLQGYKNVLDAKIDSNTSFFKIKTKLKSGRVVTTIGASSKMMNVISGYGYAYNLDKIPMKMLRFNAENTEAITVAYCISLDGKINKIQLGENSNIIKKALLGNLELENNDGSKTKIIFNPDKQEITVNGITSTNIFEVYK